MQIDFARCRQMFPTIDFFLEKVNDDKVTPELLAKIESVNLKSIDRSFLARILATQFYRHCIGSEKHAEFCFSKLFIVWSDGQTNESDSYHRREAPCDSWWEDLIVGLGTWPIALYFTERRDVSYAFLIVVVESGEHEIKNLEITVYQPPTDFDLKSVVEEITKAFSDRGEKGLNNYLNAVYCEEIFSS